LHYHAIAIAIDADIDYPAIEVYVRKGKVRDTARSIEGVLGVESRRQTRCSSLVLDSPDAIVHVPLSKLLICTRDRDLDQLAAKSHVTLMCRAQLTLQKSVAALCSLRSRPIAITRIP